MLALLFRRSLARVLENLRSAHMSRNGVVIETWNNIARDTRSNVEQPVPRNHESDRVVTAAGTARGGSRARASATVERGPRGRIALSFSRLESALRKLVGDRETDSILELGSQALSASLISPQSLRAIEGLTLLHNLALHSNDEEVTEAKASEYELLVDACLYALQNPVPRPVSSLQL